MVRLDQPHAAAGFLMALIALPLAMLLVFMNKPVISGILFITSGALSIYVFKVFQATGLLLYVIYEWTGGIGFSPSFHIGIATYATIAVGFLLFLSYYLHKRSKRKKEMQKENIGRIRHPSHEFEKSQS